MDFRVDLDIFRGPLDLLLYLVRKHEIDPADLPITKIADQYWLYLEVIEQVDVNAVGDFLDVASTLMEIKSRMALPQLEDAAEAILEDPREDLVRRLLDYKKFKDAASMLEEQGAEWQQRYTRVANDLPPRRVDLAGQPIHEVELWDLVSAFGRLVREHESMQPPTIVYDETPIQSYMQKIHNQLSTEGKILFSELFIAGMHKSAMIGVFLAVLELVRHHCVFAEQDDLHGEIVVRAGEKFSDSLELADVDDYEHKPAPK